MDFDINEYIDHQRWLMNNGILTDSVQNNLYMYGSIVHKDVKALHLAVDPDNFTVNYVIFVPNTLIETLKLYNKWKHSDKIWDMWRLRRLLKKEHNLDFEAIVSKFVHDFCGSKWKVTVKVEDEASYVDAPVEDESGAEVNKIVDRQPD